MIRVQQIKSELFTSHVYLITFSQIEEVFLIDCGAFEGVIEQLPKNAILKGIFLTHYHYDHIYFIEKWIEKYPDVIVYGSLITKEGIENPKRNLSFYHEAPIAYVVPLFNEIKEHSMVSLFYENINLHVIETEGHCEGSLSFQVDEFIFTGDTLIPNIPTVTKLKTGSKEKTKESIHKIKKLSSNHSIICPGHLQMKKATEVDWKFYLNV